MAILVPERSIRQTNISFSESSSHWVLSFSIKAPGKMRRRSDHIVARLTLAHDEDNKHVARIYSHALCRTHHLVDSYRIVLTKRINTKQSGRLRNIFLQVSFYIKKYGLSKIVFGPSVPGRRQPD